MKYVLEFELPGLPPMTNKTHGCSWQALYKKRKEWKEQVGMIARLRRPEKPLERARVTLTRFSTSRPDFDGLTSGFKPILDALKGIVIVDDAPECVGQPTYLWEKARPNYGKIRVRVEEIVEVKDEQA